MSNLFFHNPISEAELKQRSSSRGQDLRGDFFRDTTAIIHSYPFRRLKHKTQVFFTPRNDHICTRIEHVMHVATIASTICRSLNLDADLAWAIGMGHDLGHAPFGHVGEVIVGNLMESRGGFRHEIYSLRVVDHLARYGKGLNLTYAVRDGILNHCGEKFEQFIEPDFTIKDLSSIQTRDFYPSTWEGVVVRMADKIAYMGRDLEDALQLKIIRSEQIPSLAKKVLGDDNSDIINTLVSNMIQTSLDSGKIGFSDSVYEALLALKDFNYRHIYTNPLLSSYHKNFERIITTLHDYLNDLFGKYGTDYGAYKDERNFLALRFADYLRKMGDFYQTVDGNYSMAIVDYIAGMTDDYAIDCINEIMVPRKFEFQFDDFLFYE